MQTRKRTGTKHRCDDASNMNNLNRLIMEYNNLICYFFCGAGGAREYVVVLLGGEQVAVKPRVYVQAR